MSENEQNLGPNEHLVPLRVELDPEEIPQLDQEELDELAECIEDKLTEILNRRRLKRSQLFPRIGD